MKALSRSARHSKLCDGSVLLSAWLGTDVCTTWWEKPDLHLPRQDRRAHTMPHGAQRLHAG